MHIVVVWVGVADGKRQIRRWGNWGYKWPRARSFGIIEISGCQSGVTSIHSTHHPQDNVANIGHLAEHRAATFSSIIIWWTNDLSQYLAIVVYPLHLPMTPYLDKHSRDTLNILVLRIVCCDIIISPNYSSSITHVDSSDPSSSDWASTTMGLDILVPNWCGTNLQGTPWIFSKSGEIVCRY